GKALRRLEAEQVDRLVIAVTRLERAGSVVDRLRPSKGVQQQQPSRISLLEFHLQGVIAGEARAEVRVDVVELRVGAPSLERQRLAYGVRERLIQIRVDPQSH